MVMQNFGGTNKEYYGIFENGLSDYYKMIYCLITFDSQLNTTLKGVATNIPSSAYVYTVTSNNLFHLGK